MTTGDPAPQQDPNPPIDYPADAGLPPPVYPMPYAGQPGYYPGGYDPYRPLKPPGTNGKAIGSLVTSIAGFFCCGLPSIVGLVLGVVALRETKRTGQDGFALAMVGTIIGGLAVAGWALYLLLMLTVYASGWQWAP
jgi:hypothetical protein